MKQVAGLIPTYSSDEFGICSALYELGGMVVMHDASGCNSTYTTHDEPRWYDIDSMIFISAISEMEAIMGDDEKLIEDLTEAAEDLHPAFIALVGAPIPYMIGTDLKAIAALTEERTGIPCIGFEANGMHDYTKGISMALEAVTKRFCDQNVVKTKHLSVNLLGATPLDFSLNGSVEDIQTLLEQSGISVLSTMAMGSSLEEIKRAGQAHVNLVLSSGGLAAAKNLQKRFRQPYVVGVPIGEKMTAYICEHIRTAAETRQSVLAYDQISIVSEATGIKETSEIEIAKTSEMLETCKANKIANNESKLWTDSSSAGKIVIIGEAVYSASLAAAIELEYEKKVQVLCPLETSNGLLREQDLATPEEDDLLKELTDASIVIADPFYEVLTVRQETKPAFFALPHEAFSGRIYDAVNPNLIGINFNKIK